MMLHPPNTFLQFWTAKELRDWWEEIGHRQRNNWEGWKPITVPTKEQTLAEFRRRRLPIRQKTRR